MDGESSDAVGKAKEHDILVGIQSSKYSFPILLSINLVQYSQFAYQDPCLWTRSIYSFNFVYRISYNTVRVILCWKVVELVLKQIMNYANFGFCCNNFTHGTPSHALTKAISSFVVHLEVTYRYSPEGGREFLKKKKNDIH